MQDFTARRATLTDMPWLLRCAHHGVLLDNQAAFTGAWPLGAGTLAAWLGAGPGWTVLARAGHVQVAAQGRPRPAGHAAQLTLVAPRLAPGEDDSAWLLALDAMSQQAGHDGAHVLVADLDEDDALLPTLRACGFSIYTRQQVWVRPPSALAAPSAPPTPPPGHVVCAIDEGNQHAVAALLGAVVPGMMQQWGLGHVQSGLVALRAGRADCALGVALGRAGAYLTLSARHDLPYDDAVALLGTMLARLPRADRVPLALCVPRTQHWLSGVAHALGFVPLVQQALLVRHIAVGVRGVRAASLRRVPAHTLPGIARPPIPTR